MSHLQLKRLLIAVFAVGLFAAFSQYQCNAKKNEHQPTTESTGELNGAEIPRAKTFTHRFRAWDTHPAIAEQPLKPTASGSLTGLTVFVDAGHGGPDGGTEWSTPSGSKAREAEVTYQAAWQLSEILREKGASVYLTVASWHMIDMPDPAEGVWPKDAITINDRKKVLDQSTEIARRNRSKTQHRFGARFEYVTVLASDLRKAGKKSILVSLHVDSYDNNRVKGAHVCCARGLSLPLAEAIAREIDGYGVARTGTNAPLVDQRRLAIFNGVTIPGVLVELGVPANSERDYLILMDQDDRRRLLKETVAAGIASWYKSQ